MAGGVATLVRMAGFCRLARRVCQECLAPAGRESGRWVLSGTEANARNYPPNKPRLVL